MTGTGYEDFYYNSTDGLKLHARIYGERNPSALPAICLAGLTRNAADFHDLALFLARHPKTPRQVIAFDYRGRGRSTYDRDWKNYNVVIESGDILAGLAAMGIEHGAFIGTSRGGLIIHILGAMRPAVLKAIVLNDVGPVIEGAGLAQIRAYLERAPKPRTFAEAIEISRAAQKDNFPALKEADWERMAHAFYREENGTLVADFDPALLNTMTSIDLNKPLPQMWPQFEGLRGVLMLAIRGENSKLLSVETIEEMARRHPGMETVTVEGQGHAPLLETVDLPERIAAFLEKAERG
ncbi:alpha/beta fold hydrolase [Mesorhizobium australicum]|uniref:Pimeloyl-ACP methyl ester carboxylesterase n=1 Tax=Mesorhizobium australicum TaxID=536018 RepID=A0A1X7NZU1_9HYPH|nr:alpha/beta hydrolase [Mesorhizobium australicum]SMH43504.1 Pimeloyl-ACP methyl ester carboxylesterase [Mesorhizobium australicum]